MRQLNRKHWPYQCKVPVDDTYPSFDKYTHWLTDQGVSPAEYFHYSTRMNRSTFAFKNEDIMTLFMLRFG